MGRKRENARGHAAKRPSTALVFFLVLVLIWFIGLVKFAKSIPGGVADEHTRTNAIVVLTGGSKRLDEGFALLSNGMADRLFISGVYRGVEAEHLFRLFKHSPGKEACCIDIGRDADDTVGNARETSDWVEKNNLKSIRLVTAGYHMPRSLLEFQHAMPGVEIVPHPVFPDAVIMERWWMWPGTAQLILSEYTKFMLAKVLHWIQLATPEHKR